MDQAQMAVISHALNTNLRSIVIVIICPMIWPYGHRISRMSFLYSYSKILPIMTLNVGIQNSELYFFLYEYNTRAQKFEIVQWPQQKFPTYITASQICPTD